VWATTSASRETSILGGLAVSGISPLLKPESRLSGTPYKLAANARLAFNGSKVDGLGFMVTIETAQALKSLSSRNESVIWPFINAEDLCSRADVSPRRLIINFRDWSLEEASQYVAPFAIVREKVKPERDRNRRRTRRERWWLFAETTPALNAALASVATVIAMPSVSKFSMPMRLPSTYVYSHALAIFASESDALYGFISSEIHRSWSRTRGSTMRNDSRYTPTDCFETFALPSDDASTIGETMRTLHGHRAALMRASERGLTAAYNRVHAPKETDAEVLILRELHRTLDVAVLAAYGWADVDLDHDFRETDEGLRFTISDAARVEILDRLLELNHERHAAEVASGAWGAPRRKNGSARGLKNADGPPALINLT